MQNIIAVIWDFDKTLIDGNMQDPIFEEYHIDKTEFWKEVNALPAKYAEEGIRVYGDTIYLKSSAVLAKNRSIIPAFPIFLRTSKLSWKTIPAIRNTISR